MYFLPSKCHKDIFKLQRVRHFGPLDADVVGIGVLRLVVEPARQRDGAAAVRHHFTRSRLHDHRSSVVLCRGKTKSVGFSPVDSLIYAINLLDL